VERKYQQILLLLLVLCIILEGSFSNVMAFSEDNLHADIFDAQYTVVKKYNLDEASGTASEYFKNKGGASSSDRTVVDIQNYSNTGSAGKSVKLTVTNLGHRHTVMNLISQNDYESNKRYRITAMVKLYEDCLYDNAFVKILPYATVDSGVPLTSEVQLYKANKDNWTKVSFEYDESLYKPLSAAVLFSSTADCPLTASATAPIICYIDDISFEQVGYKNKVYDFNCFDSAPVFLKGKDSTLSFAELADETNRQVVIASYNSDGGIVYANDMFSGMDAAEGKKYKISMGVKMKSGEEPVGFKLGVVNSSNYTIIESADSFMQISSDEWMIIEHEVTVQSSLMSAINSGTAAIVLLTDSATFTSDLSVYINSVSVKKIVNTDPSVVLRVELKSDGLYISGLLEEENANRNISVSLAADEVAYSDCVNITVDDSGAYAVTFPLLDISENKVKLLITVSDLLVYDSGYLSVEYNYINLNSISRLLTNIASMKDENEAIVLLSSEDTIDALAFDSIDLFAQSEYKTDVYHYIYRNRNMVLNEEKTYDLEPIHTLIKEGVLLSNFEHGTSTEIGAILKEHADILGIAGLDTYNIGYLNLIFKQDVHEQLMRPYATLDEFATYFVHTVEKAVYASSFIKAFNFNDNSALPSTVSGKNLVVSVQSGANCPEEETGNALKLSSWANYGFVTVTNLFDSIPLVEGRRYKVSFDSIITNDEGVQGDETLTKNYKVSDKGEFAIGLATDDGNVIFPDSYTFYEVVRDKWNRVELDFTADTSLISVLGDKKPVIVIVPSKNFDYGNITAGTGRRYIAYVDNIRAERDIDGNSAINVEKNQNGLIVSGETELENANQNAILYFIKEGYATDDFSQQALINSYSITFDNMGKYRVNIPYFPMGKFSNKLSITINPINPYYKSTLSTNYTYEDVNYIKQTLESIKALDSEAAAIDYLSQPEISQICGFEELDIYEMIPDKNYIYKYIYTNKDDIINSNDLYDRSLLWHAVKTAVSLYYIENGTAEEIENCLIKYASELGIAELAAFTNIFSVSKNKTPFCLALKGTFESKDMFSKQFTSIILKTSFSDVISYSSMMKMIEDCSADLNLNLSAYYKLSDAKKSDAAKQLTSYFKNASSYNDANTQLQKIIDGLSGDLDSINEGVKGLGNTRIDNNSYKTLLEESKQAVTNQSKFNDIDVVGWALNCINALAEQNILSGYGDGSFRPNNHITRAEVAKIITVGFKINITDASFDYRDVLENDWYRPYVAALVSNKITNGVGNGLFGSAEYVTRQDLVTFLYRTAVKTGKIIDDEAVELLFKDKNDIADYAKLPVANFEALGIVHGIGDGNFAPKQYATRAETAQMLFAALYN